MSAQKPALRSLLLVRVALIALHLVVLIVARLGRAAVRISAIILIVIIVVSIRRMHAAGANARRVDRARGHEREPDAVQFENVRGLGRRQ